MKALYETSISSISKFGIRKVLGEFFLGAELELIKTNDINGLKWFFCFNKVKIGLLKKRDIDPISWLIEDGKLTCRVKRIIVKTTAISIEVAFYPCKKFNVRNEEIVEKNNFKDAISEKYLTKTVQKEKNQDDELISLKNQEVTGTLFPFDHLNNLFNVGFATSKKLNALGVQSCEDLLNFNSDTVPQKCGITMQYIEKLKKYALSYKHKKILQLKKFEFNHQNVIYIDIETDIEPVDFEFKKIWFISVLNGDDYLYYFAENWEKEFDILSDFLKYLSVNSNKTLVSYSGTNFDFSILSKAIKRNGLDSDFFSSFKHIDIYSVIKNAFVFPIKQYGLKDLGKFLGYNFKAPNLDGLNVSISYQNCIENNKEIPDEIFYYAEDDVRAIRFIIDKLILIDRLSKVKLDIELVPTSCWWSNVRSNVSQEQWDLIRRSVYRESQYKCEVCGGKGEHHPVECHEVWEYDEVKFVQKLVGFKALCPNCHAVKHIGLSDIKGLLSNATDWFMKINNISENEAEYLINEAWKAWNRRNTYNWTLNIEFLKNYNIDTLNLKID